MFTQVYGKTLDYFETPKWLAERIVAHFEPSGLCLDPCRGNGVFYDLLPSPKDFCEISENRDFFTWTKKVNWIISNPPYSILTKWLEHSYKVADNIVYLIPISKLLSSNPRMETVKMRGYIKEIFYVGNGRSVGFPFGFPCAAVHLKTDYRGPTTISWAEQTRPIAAK